VSALYEEHYASLVRLAALLVHDISGTHGFLAMRAFRELLYCFQNRCA